MNFLSHYFAEQPEEDPYFILGLALPDLTRIFNKDWRLPPAESHNYFKDFPVLERINRGVYKHQLADKIFHNSDFFKEHTASISESFRNVEFDSISKYKFFLAHILLEMMLDRIIVKSHEHIGHEFYDNLDNVDKTYVALYLKTFNFKGDTKEFFVFLQRFITSRYLFDYKHNESFIFALNRVYRRAMQTSFTDQDKTRLVLLNEYVETSLQSTYLPFFKSLRKQLSA